MALALSNRGGVVTMKEGFEMAFTTEIKAGIVAEYQHAQGDTGSPEMQIALLPARIKDSNTNFKE